MVDNHFQSDEEMLLQPRVDLGALIEGAKPYLATVLIVTILLSIWVSLRALIA